MNYRVQIFKQLFELLWGKSMGASPTRHTFARADSTSRTGKAMPMKHLHCCRIPGHHIMNNHVCCNRLRHVSYPHWQHSKCLRVTLLFVIVNRSKIRVLIPTLALRYYSTHGRDMTICRSGGFCTRNPGVSFPALLFLLSACDAIALLECVGNEEHRKAEW